MLEKYVYEEKTLEKAFANGNPTYPNPITATSILSFIISTTLTFNNFIVFFSNSF